MCGRLKTAKLQKNQVVRSGIRTHAHIRGPECSPTQVRYNLESGALDHSAILTHHGIMSNLVTYIYNTNTYYPDEGTGCALYPFH